MSGEPGASGRRAQSGRDFAVDRDQHVEPRRLGPGFELARNYMLLGGGGALSEPSVWTGGICDIVIGLLILYRPTAKIGLLAALVISVGYIVAGTILLPELWREPLGPMMKIWPILVLNLVCLAILDER